MKDMMLKQNETVLYTELARVEGQRGEVESTLQHVSFHDGVQRDEEQAGARTGNSATTGLKRDISEDM